MTVTVDESPNPAFERERAEARPLNFTLELIMRPPLFAVVLNSGCPPELFALLKDYIQSQDPSMKFVLCSELDSTGAFLRCNLVQNKTNKLGWVQIPYGCVVALAELSQGKLPPGFLSGDQ